MCVPVLTSAVSEVGVFRDCFLQKRINDLRAMR